MHILYIYLDYHEITDKDGTSKCIWDGKKLTWDNNEKCVCYKSCKNPTQTIQFQRGLTIGKCDNMTNNGKCNINCPK